MCNAVMCLLTALWLHFSHLLSMLPGLHSISFSNVSEGILCKFILSRCFLFYLAPPCPHHHLAHPRVGTFAATYNGFTFTTRSDISKLGFPPGRVAVPWPRWLCFWWHSYLCPLQVAASFGPPFPGREAPHQSSPVSILVLAARLACPAPWLGMGYPLATFCLFAFCLSTG